MNKADSISTFLLASLLALAPQTAQSSDWLISGFGTVGASYISDKNIFFSLPGKRRTERSRFDFGSNSVLGLQLERSLGSTTSAVIQFRSHDHSNNRFKPEINRAFVRHELTPVVTIRAGRLHTPSFMWSESLDLNFGQPWVRPPLEVYAINPLTEVEGVDMIIRTRIAAYDIELQPYFGAGGLHSFPNGRARYSSHKGLAVSVEKEGLLLHFGHGSGSLSIASYDQLHSIAESITGPGSLSGRKAKASFSSIGFRYEVDRTQIFGEWARRTVDRYVNSAYGWQMTAAYRTGKFTHFATIARQTQTRSVIPYGFPANPVLSLFEQSRNPSQRSLTLGVRWDAGRNHAFKAQWSRVEVPNNAWGAFLPRSANPNSSPAGKKFDMFSLSMDFVF